MGIMPAFPKGKECHKAIVTAEIACVKWLLTR
jgi:hypothetical protein